MIIGHFILYLPLMAFVFHLQISLTFSKLFPLTSVYIWAEVGERSKLHKLSAAQVSVHKQCKYLSAGRSVSALQRDCDSVKTVMKNKNFFHVKQAVLL